MISRGYARGTGAEAEGALQQYSEQVQHIQDLMFESLYLADATQIADEVLGKLSPEEKALLRIKSADDVAAWYIDIVRKSLVASPNDEAKHMEKIQHVVFAASRAIVEGAQRDKSTLH